MVEERMMKYINDVIVPLRTLPYDTPAIGQPRKDDDESLFPREFGPEWINGNFVLCEALLHSIHLFDSIRIVAIFGHAMAFKCVLRHVTGSVPLITRRVEISNTSITELVLKGTLASKQLDFHGLPTEKWSWIVRRTNDIKHLTNQ
jgi:hypothetical protein